MNKKIFSTIAITSTLISCSSNKSNKKEIGFQPNIIWITCEDISPYLGCYGDEDAISPNIDNLADEGIRYTNAFSVAGVSAPSRNALITGMYPTSIGGHNMRTIWSTTREDLPEEYSIVTPQEVKCFTEYLRMAGYYCTNNSKTDYQFYAPLTAWDESSDAAHWKNRKPGQPFFAVFNDISTHESRQWLRNGELFMVDPDSVDVPPYLPDTEKVRKAIARNYTNIAEMDMHVGLILKELEKSNLLDSSIIFFYSDHGGPLPRGKRELYETGIKIPLIIRFPNKMYAGKVNDNLVSFVDFAPTVLSLAEIKIPDYMQGQAFLGKYKSQTDRKYIYAARDRMDSEYDRVRAVRDKQFKYFKNYFPELPYVQNIEYRKNIPMMLELYELNKNGLLTGDAALWWRKTKPQEELYDVINDPYELNNLADIPEFSEKLTELRNELKNWQKKFGDLGKIDEKELIKTMWNGNNSPPLTDTAKIKIIENNLIAVNCKTKGASIGYQINNEIGSISWYIYINPISINKVDSIKIYSKRIGYKESITKTFKKGIDF